jgi:membrane dipeptidase
MFVDATTVAPQNAARNEKLRAQQAELNEKFKDDPERLAEESDKLEAANPLPPLPISKLIDHIDHIVKVAGIDHVGIGADFDGITIVVQGLEDVSKYPALFAELSRRGWSEQDLQKLAGENIVRVFEQAETVAKRLQRERPPSTATIEQLDHPGKRPPAP